MLAPQLRNRINKNAFSVEPLINPRIFYNWVDYQPPHLIEWRRVRRYMLDHVVERDEQTNEREALTRRQVVRPDRREAEQRQRHAHVEVVRRQHTRTNHSPRVKSPIARCRSQV